MTTDATLRSVPQVVATPELLLTGIWGQQPVLGVSLLDHTVMQRALCLRP